MKHVTVNVKNSGWIKQKIRHSWREITVLEDRLEEIIQSMAKRQRKLTTSWTYLGFPYSSVKSLPAMGSIPGSGRSPGEGNGNSLQYSYLENPMER